MRGETSKASAFDLVEDRGDLRSEEKTIECVTGNLFLSLVFAFVRMSKQKQ